MSDSSESAGEATAREAAKRFDTGTRERPLPINAARQSAFVSGAEWQREQDESESMKVAAQRAVRISELEAEVAELTEALIATHRNGERDLQKMEIAWGELAALKAKLAKVRVLAEADKRCPCCSGYGHILAILDGETE